MTSLTPSQARAAALRATADRHRRAGKEWLASELERLAERTVVGLYERLNA